MNIRAALHAQGLSLNIPAGTSCALVGTSGSGKSTVLRLLFRFYEPDSGALSVAGRNVTDYTMKSLRAKIGEVSHRWRCCCVCRWAVPPQAARLLLSAQRRGMKIKTGAMKANIKALAGMLGIKRPASIQADPAGYGGLCNNLVTLTFLEPGEA